MGTAYTPGLTVSGQAAIRKTRRLPRQGEVLVQVGESVSPDTVVARTELPGEVSLVRAADKLGVQGSDLLPLLRVQVGDRVEAGQVLAETPGLFGRFLKTTLTAPVAGTVETITERTGNLTLRHPPKAVLLNAYVRGTVADILPHEGAVIEARGALVQGIFGIGGERWGKLRVVAGGDAAALGEVAGAVVVVPGRATRELYDAAAAAGAAGLVAGSVLDVDLRGILGHDIGVAITGEEDVPATLIITEGFGEVTMAERTFALLRGLDGHEASISGATQIRAGVVRPELVVPDPAMPPEAVHERTAETQQLEVGTRVRLIREPWFGRLGTVTALPAEPVAVASEAQVRVLEADLGGESVVVPRANVEIVVGGEA